MKNSFTLIEILVVMVIITLLISGARPIYDKYILKTRSEEAKATLLALAFSEERYYQEMGEYYPPNSIIDLGDFVQNEEYISNSLKIDLSKSNNFIYTIMRDDIGNYLIRVYLRRDISLCIDSDDIYTFCKQRDAQSIDNWANSYNNFDENNRYIEFQYPTKLIGDLVEEGINYEYLFQ